MSGDVELHWNRRFYQCGRNDCRDAVCAAQNQARIVIELDPHETL